MAEDRLIEVIVGWSLAIKSQQFERIDGTD